MVGIMVDTEALKRTVAREAAKNVASGDVIGIGSGTTIKLFIEELAGKIRDERLRILSVPTSYDTAMLAAQHGVPLTTLEEHPVLSKCFDGADKVDRSFNMIKGGGGCHTREKIVASASKIVHILVDYKKLVNQITGEQRIPVEIIPFSYPFVSNRLMKVGGTLELRYAGSAKMGPILGDNGGFIGDVSFSKIADLNQLDAQLNSIPGLIEHGLFLGMADLVHVAFEDRVEVLKRRKGES